MIQRTEYLQQLIQWKHDDLIKVVTGIRRCGKSTLLQLFAQHLKSEGIREEQILFINFEDLANEDLLHYKALYDYVSARLCKGEWTYVLLDEVQNVENFQKAVDSLYVQDKVDIYMTGSNAYMLSGNLATLLSGRYVEISMLPLSFREYCDARPDVSKEDAFADYLRFGGFPYAATSGAAGEKTDRYLEGIYNTIVVKDVEYRQNRIAGNKSVDVALLQSVCRYLADVVGSPVSMKSIGDYLRSNRRAVSDHTVSDYVDALVEAFVFYPAERFDVKGKELLKTNKKFYIVDTGLRNFLLTKRSPDVGHALENIVFLELKRRGYRVNVGKLDAREVDFVAQKNGVSEYFQVAASLGDEKVFQRETAPLADIRDNYRKTVLTLDKFSVGNYGGIEVKNVVDWLLNY